MGGVQQKNKKGFGDGFRSFLVNSLSIGISPLPHYINYIIKIVLINYSVLHCYLVMKFNLEYDMINASLIFKLTGK